MLLKAEEIISDGKLLVSADEDKIYRMIKEDLAKKIVDLMFEKGLAKTEFWYNSDSDRGNYVSVRVTVRAYNPDD